MNYKLFLCFSLAILSNGLSAGDRDYSWDGNLNDYAPTTEDEDQSERNARQALTEKLPEIMRFYYKNRIKNPIEFSGIDALNIYPEIAKMTTEEIINYQSNLILKHATPSELESLSKICGKIRLPYEIRGDIFLTIAMGGLLTIPLALDISQSNKAYKKGYAAINAIARRIKSSTTHRDGLYQGLQVKMAVPDDTDFDNNRTAMIQKMIQGINGALSDAIAIFPTIDRDGLLQNIINKNNAYTPVFNTDISNAFTIATHLVRLVKNSFPALQRIFERPSENNLAAGAFLLKWQAITFGDGGYYEGPYEPERGHPLNRCSKEEYIKMYKEHCLDKAQAMSFDRNLKGDSLHPKRMITDDITWCLHFLNKAAKIEFTNVMSAPMSIDNKRLKEAVMYQKIYDFSGKDWSNINHLLSIMEFEKMNARGNNHLRIVPILNSFFNTMENPNSDEARYHAGAYQESLNAPRGSNNNNLMVNAHPQQQSVPSLNFEALNTDEKAPAPKHYDSDDDM